MGIKFSKTTLRGRWLHQIQPIDEECFTAEGWCSQCGKMDVERYCDEVDETTGLRFKTFDKGKQFGIDGYSNGEVIL